MGNDCYNEITLTTKTSEMMTELYNDNFKELLENEKTLENYEKSRINLIEKVQVD